MLEWLNQIDTALFVFLNVTLANPVFDVLMPFITHAETWYPVWVVLFIMMLWKGGVKGRWFIVVAILAVALSDQAVNQLMKPFFERIRPCNVVEGCRMLVPCSRSFSMPSSHAVNFFTTATVLAFFYPRYQGWYWSIAFLVGYSRIAVARHYPFDVLVGALTGILFALFCIYLFKYVRRRYNLPLEKDRK
ncbi:MAG: phosphatase PAP2 family protein [Calditrichaceae bacterium]|nr:phosphatase PAP2 family protein [Calditrichaceae bacterium]MBN2709125.1 phosphatase PAP2 family protein [Calditrichaceae bacterium]